MKRILTAAVFVILAAATAMGAVERSYTAGSFAVYLEGTFAGYVNKMSGGFAEAKVVEQLPPNDYYVKKSTNGTPSYKQITLVVSGGMSTAFYDWIRETLVGKSRWRNGSIVTTDYTGKPVRAIDFHEAQITQVAFSRLDAESKETYSFTVQIAPSRTTVRRNPPTPPASGQQKSSKKWLAANFDFGLDGASNLRTAAVEAIVINIPAIDRQGPVCETSNCPPLAINFPDIEVTLAATGSEPVVRWYEESVYNGRNQEKNGTIRVLSPSQRDPIFTLDLHNLGVISVEQPEADGLQATVALRMYSEFILLQVAPGS